MKNGSTAWAILAGSLLVAAVPVENALALDLGATVEACGACHGKDGVSTESDVPTIAGYSGDYVATALQGYQKKERVCHETKFRSGPHKGETTDMCQAAKGLSESDTEKIGNYFAGKKFVRATQAFDEALAKKGNEIHDANCDKCHLEAGTVASDNAGILAGQHAQYLRTQFEDLKAGKRDMPKRMKPKIDALQPADIDALVNFYASFK